MSAKKDAPRSQSRPTSGGSRPIGGQVFMAGTLGAVTIAPCGPERADDIHRLTQTAFKPHSRLDPPSGAVKETINRVVEDLASGGGAVAEIDNRPVGCLRWQLADTGDLHVRRVAVLPELQRRGLGRVLMVWSEEEARRRGCEAVSVGVRVTLPDNLAFYSSLGYELTGERRHDGYEETTWLSLRKTLAIT